MHTSVKVFLLILGFGVLLIALYAIALGVTHYTWEPAKGRLASDYSTAVPIDFVVTWVDGNDDERNTLRKKTRAEMNGVAYNPGPNSNLVSRFMGHDELKYQLRSIEKYAPWIRHVYVVASGGQKPPFLNLDHPRLTIVDDSELFDESELPIFNSHALESRFHKIPGLSEIFLYGNDDMMFNAPVSPDMFYKNGKLRLYCDPIRKAWSGELNPKQTSHHNAWRNNNRLLDAEFGKSIRAYPSHQITALSKSAMRIAEGMFNDEWKATSLRKFRSMNDVHPTGLTQYTAAYMGMAEWNDGGHLYLFRADDRRYFNWLQDTTAKMGKPPLMCFNDNMSHDDKKVTVQFCKILETRYPDPSGYEK